MVGFRPPKQIKPEATLRAFCLIGVSEEGGSGLAAIARTPQQLGHLRLEFEQAIIRR